MKQYVKNGQVVTRPKSLIFEGRTYLNPKDDILIKAGYEIKDYEPVKPVVTNETIKRQRQTAYRMRADQYLTAYQAYKELGETEKALEMKTLWLEERKKIDAEYPYLTEEIKTDVEQSKTE
jgi:hypothetical protein